MERYSSINASNDQYQRSSATWSAPLRWQCRFHNCRHKRRRLVLVGLRRCLVRLPAPREHLLWGEALPPSNFGNHRARSKCLPNHLRLKIVRELSPPTRPRDHLYPANRRHFRLKLMVKRRHEPISHSEISTLDHHPAS
jgi:hypothetical protein